MTQHSMQKQEKSYLGWLKNSGKLRSPCQEQHEGSGLIFNEQAAQTTYSQGAEGTNSTQWPWPTNP